MRLIAESRYADIYPAGPASWLTWSFSYNRAHRVGYRQLQKQDKHALILSRWRDDWPGYSRIRQDTAKEEEDR